MFGIWRKWPYWLKGGVIGGGVTLAFVLIYYGCNAVLAEGFLCLIPLFFSPLYPIANFIDSYPLLRETPILFLSSLTILGLLLWFTIGSIIGLLVGYLKSNKKSSSP